MKKLSKVLVVVDGILFLLFGLFHITFFRVFNFSPGFQQIKPVLVKIVYMLNIGLISFFLTLGILMLYFRNDILNTKLGRAFLISSSAFFFIRGSAEFFFPGIVPGLIAVMFVCSSLYLIPAVSKSQA